MEWLFLFHLSLRMRSSKAIFLFIILIRSFENGEAMMWLTHKLCELIHNKNRKRTATVAQQQEIIVNNPTSNAGEERDDLVKYLMFAFFFFFFFNF